jgi:hypothetical protein
LHVFFQAFVIRQETKKLKSSQPVSEVGITLEFGTFGSLTEGAACVTGANRKQQQEDDPSHDY